MKSAKKFASIALFLTFALFINGCSRSNVLMDFIGGGAATSTAKTARYGVLGSISKNITSNGYTVSAEVLFSPPMTATTSQGYKITLQQGF